MLRALANSLMLLTVLSALQAGAAKKILTPSPVKSSETVEFTSKKDQALLDLSKTEFFEGLLTRTEEKGDLRLVDYYAFKNFPVNPMDRTLCERFLAGIFGPLDKISLKVESIEIYLSHTGKTCDARIIDEDKEARAPERRVIAGYLSARPIALVFRLSKKSTPTEQESIRKFWDSLR